MRRYAVAAGLALAALCTDAGANGRPPATSTLHFEVGNPQHVVAGMTFGALFSNDNGTTWNWVCEAAFPYSGVYDPSYQYTATGAVFATTFNGLRVMRDGCTFNSTPEGDTFISNVVLGSNSVIVTASAPTDSNIYTSTDDGQTFAVSASPGIPDDWWESYAIAPSNPQRVYLTGYRFLKICGPGSLNAGSACALDAQCTTVDGGLGTCETEKLFLMFRSDDGGATFQPISQANITDSSSSAIDVVGIGSADPDLVYIKVSFEDGAIGDGLYKSTTGGGSGSADPSAWTKILDRQDPNGMVALLRADGSLLAGTETLGMTLATAPAGSGCTSEASCGWTALTNPPHVGCLYEQPGSHDVWACTQNYGNGSNIPSDGAGIMKSSDLATWTPLLKFQEITGPVTCGSDSLQAQQCVAPYMGAPSVWCCLVVQIGIADSPISCTGAYTCTYVTDAGTAGGDNSDVKSSKGGCCNTGGGASGALLLTSLVGILLYRRRIR